MILARAWIRRNADPTAVFVSLGVLLLVCLHWWHPGQVIAQGDNPPIVTPGIWFMKSLGAWSVYNSYFGQVDGSFTFLPFMLLWWPADRIFGASLGQIVIDYALIAAAWIGAYRILRLFGVSAAAAAIGAWLYTINPFTQLVFGTNLTLGIFWGLLAWLAFWIVRASLFPGRGGWARLWLVILAFAGIPMLGVTPSLVFQTVAAVLVLAGLGWLTTADRRAFLRWMVSTAISMILAALWWAVPDVLSFAGATIPHPTAISDLAWTYARSSLLNDLRFLYTWLWAYPEYFPVAPAYDGNIISYAAGFLLIAAALAGLIVLRGRDLIVCRYALAFALIVAFIAKGTHPPLAFVNSALAFIPGSFLVYADPAGEAALAILLLAIAGGLLFNAVTRQQRVRNSRALRLALPTITLAAILASAWPLVAGSIFHGPVVASNGTLMSSEYVAVPSYWRRASDYLNSVRGDAGVLMLPPHLSSGYDVAYGFGYYGVDAVATNLIRRRLLYLDAGLFQGLGYLKHVEGQSLIDRVRVLLDTNPRLARSLIQDIGIRYVLYRGDFVHEKNAWYSQRELTARLGREPMQFGPLALYDLGTAQDVFTLQPNWISGIYATASAGDLEELGALEEPLPRVDASAVPPQFSGLPRLFEATGQVQDMDSTPAAPQGRGVDRALSFASLAPANSNVVIRSAARRELRVSMGAIPDPIIVSDVPLKALRRQNPTGMLLLTARVLATSDKHGTLTLTESVQNFGSRAVWADILVAVPAQPNRNYLLAANGFVYSPATQKGGPGFVLRFPHVLLPPGEDTVELIGRLVPGRPAGSAFAGRVGENTIYNFYFANQQSGGAPAIIGSASVGAPPVTQLVEAGTLPLQYKAAEDPSVELNTSVQSSQVAAIVQFVSGTRAYICPTALVPGVGVDISYAVNRCLTQNLLSLPLSTVTIRDVHFVATDDQAALSTLAADGRVLVSVRPVDFAGEPLEAPVMVAKTHDPHTLYTMRWPLEKQALQPYDVISLRVDGCASASDPPGASVIVRTAAGGKPSTYRQQLFPTPDGADAGEAVFSIRQTFGRVGALRLRDMTATCSVDVGKTGTRHISVRSTLLRRSIPALQLQAAGVGKVTLPATGTVVRSIANAMLPLPVQFGNMPPTASIASLGIPPSAAPATSQGCGRSGATCNGGIVTAAVPRGFTGLALFNQLYSPSWFAFEVGNGLSLPSHVRADGWRNAWFITRPGTLIVINLVNTFVVAALVLGLGVIAWQIKRIRA